MDTQYRSAIANAFRLTPEQLGNVTKVDKAPAEIVPDDVQCELIMLREKKRDIFFRIGDIANELILLHKGTVSNKKVYKSVSKYCDSSPRTIRYYAETAAFFPQAMRDKYDVLPFSHFDLARNYNGRWEWVLALGAEHPSWSRSYLEKYTNSYFKEVLGINSDHQESVYDPVLRINGEVIKAKDFVPLEDFEIDYSVVEYDAAGRPCAFGTYTPTRPKVNSARLVGEIAALSENVIQLLDRYGSKLPEELKDRLVDHLVGINSELPAITIALDSDGTK